MKWLNPTIREWYIYFLPVGLVFLLSGSVLTMAFLKLDLILFIIGYGLSLLGWVLLHRTVNYFYKLGGGKFDRKGNRINN